MTFVYQICFILSGGQWTVAIGFPANETVVPSAGNRREKGGNLVFPLFLYIRKFQTVAFGFVFRFQPYTEQQGEKA